MFICEKCCKQFNHKGNYNKHIKKKMPCGINKIDKKSKKEENYLITSNELKYDDNINYVNVKIKNTGGGQYFTTHNTLKEKIFEFILNNPSNILEPSIGQGDLITYIACKLPNVTFDMY